MSNYTDKRDALGKTPVTLITLTIDECNNEFGVAPCVATGSGDAKCHKTYHTCKDKPHYSKGSKDYKFTSAGAPVPFKANERPYIKDVTSLPTEIKTNFSWTGRIKATMIDEPDGDVGIDPYVTERSLFPVIPGTFWKKFIARNPNYKGRPAKKYEGFSGLQENEFAQKFIGKIDSISMKNGVVIEMVDLLKTLADIEVPKKIDCKLAADISATEDVITLAFGTASSISDIDVPSGGGKAYVIIGKEVIGYTAVNTSTNQITGCTANRGAFFTTAATHTKNDKVGKTRYYPPMNPYDILEDEMLVKDAALDAAYIDSAAFTYWKTWPVTDINYSALITEPTKLQILYFEIVELLDGRSWISEGLKITFRKPLPNKPGQTYKTFTDTENIIYDTDDVDLNEKSMYTKYIMYWGKSALGKMDDKDEFDYISIGEAVSAEGPNDKNEVIEKKFFCRWIRATLAAEELLVGYTKALVLRKVRSNVDIQPIITCRAGLKDQDIHTGDFLRCSTGALNNADGTPLSDEKFQVIKREPKNNKIFLSLGRVGRQRIAFFAPAGTPDYLNASDEEREYAFFANAKGEMPDGSLGYTFY